MVHSRHCNCGNYHTVNDRYPYLRARALRIARELTAIEEGCGNILARLESPLVETFDGKLNPDKRDEARVALLRKRVKDAIIHLKVGTE